MSEFNTDFLIVGSGMVGLTLAYELKKNYPNQSITIIEKESFTGKHSSGRNSGVIHAGIYYKPNSLKAKVCVEGAKKLIKWCDDENVPLLRCGKIILPQTIKLESQIDFLLNRGIQNGAQVSILNQEELNQKIYNANPNVKRALWSPNTCVVDPIKVLFKLVENLKEKGVKFLFDSQIRYINNESGYLKIYNKSNDIVKINFGHAFNVAGIHAASIASLFGIEHSFEVLPFKGTYWELDLDCPIKIPTNLYPVPDLSVPFLGVHFTPSLSGKVYVGPTAIPALGKENYRFWEKIDPDLILNSFFRMSLMWISNQNGFRGYASEQLIHFFKPFFIQSARQLVPSLRPEYLLPSSKVGIRSQLYDKDKNLLVDDFIIYRDSKSTHVLNAISPAFTAGFKLAEIILSP